MAKLGPPVPAKSAESARGVLPNGPPGVLGRTRRIHRNRIQLTKQTLGSQLFLIKNNDFHLIFNQKRLTSQWFLNKMTKLGHPTPAKSAESARGVLPNGPPGVLGRIRRIHRKRIQLTKQTLGSPRRGAG